MISVFSTLLMMIFIYINRESNLELAELSVKFVQEWQFNKILSQVLSNQHTVLHFVILIFWSLYQFNVQAGSMNHGWFIWLDDLQVVAKCSLKNREVRKLHIGKFEVGKFSGLSNFIFDFPILDSWLFKLHVIPLFELRKLRTSLKVLQYLENS